MNPVRTATVFTHRRPSETAPAISMLVAAARAGGAVLRLDPEETRKHGLFPEPGLELDARVLPDVDMCFALGGDGTVLGFASSGLPGPKGNLESFVWLAESARGGVADIEAAAREVEP